MTAGRPPGGPRPRTADAAVSDFCRLLREELHFRGRHHLDTGELRRYLHPLFDSRGNLSRTGMEGYSRRLLPVVELILAAPPGLKILDAGCGYGTESLLFAWLGGDVTAVELVPERADLAESRTEFFAGRSPVPLKLRFVRANVLKFLRRPGSFDLIWAMEAISHIFPPQEFLFRAGPRLAPDGVLGLSDPNLANPFAWLRAVRIRGSIRHSPHHRFRDPESGEPVDYGQEKIFSVFGLERLLRRTGYRVEAAHVSGFLGARLIPESWRDRRLPAGTLCAFQRGAEKIPLLRRLGANYTILARRKS